MFNAMIITNEYLYFNCNLFVYLFFELNYLNVMTKNKKLIFNKKLSIIVVMIPNY